MYHLKFPALLLLLLVLLQCVTTAPNNSPQHHIEKRRCNTATCLTQRLADYLIRSSNTVGTVYIPTNIGANTYGKRDVFQSANSLPL
ncbi:islet amyloid polypeptide, partial [Silurus asotus]